MMTFHEQEKGIENKFVLLVYVWMHPVLVGQLICLIFFLINKIGPPFHSNHLENIQEISNPREKYTSQNYEGIKFQPDLAQILIRNV